MHTQLRTRSCCAETDGRIPNQGLQAIPLYAAIFLELHIGTELLLKAMHNMLVYTPNPTSGYQCLSERFIFKLDQTFVYVHISRFVLKKNFLTPEQRVDLPKYKKF
jgi:hypothetical protein